MSDNIGTAETTIRCENYFVIRLEVNLLVDLMTRQKLDILSRLGNFTKLLSVMTPHRNRLDSELSRE